MEEVYNLYQHEYSVIIELDDPFTNIYVYHRIMRDSDGLLIELREKTCIKYNKQTLKVVNWGNASYEEVENETYIQIDCFLDILYDLFKKDKGKWNEEDKFLKTAVSDFISLVIKKLMEEEDMKHISSTSLHYGIIVPSEWEDGIREDLIRPIFIQAGLLSINDHNDRLLFITDLECAYYGFYQKTNFKRGQNTIMIRFNYFDDQTILIKLDLINTSNTLFDFPGSKLFPKVVRSNLGHISYDMIKGWIMNFLIDELSIDDDQTDTIQEMTECIYNDIALKKTCKKKYMGNRAIYNNEYGHCYYYEKLNEFEKEKVEKFLMGSLTLGKMEWLLNDSQKTFLKSLSRFDFWCLLGKPLFNNIKDLISNNFTKEYTISLSKFVPNKERVISDSVSSWIQFLLRSSILEINKITKLHLKQVSFYKSDNICVSNVAFRVIRETIKNSEIYGNPCIVPSKNLATSSSVFQYSKPEVIINIDISLNSTVISHFFLNDDGSIKEPFDQNYLVGEKWLPSLKTFYNVSNEVTLNIEEQFISIADKYLNGDTSSLRTIRKFLSKVKKILNKNYSNKKKVSANTYQKYVPKIKKILYKDYSNETNIALIHHRKYIQEFFFMYLIYIKELISRKLGMDAKSNKSAIKIGYTFSIEKLLLDKIPGNEEYLRKLIYASGLVNRNNDSTKLRVITQGEGILSIFQQIPDLDFPVKSYFVLAQLREDYIQVTLNQVVTAYSLNEQQEAIIVEDKMIPIKNIYDSLCLNMWNNIIENSSLVVLCDTHKKSCVGYGILEIFSLESKKEFVSNLKEHILNNILASNSNLENIKEGVINFSRFCNCKVHLEVNDIIYICFKPVLQNITAIIMSSLLNKSLLGEYTYIKYLFSLVHWNSNPQFHKIISKMLDTEPYYFNPKRGIDTICMTIPEIPNQLLQPIPKLHSFLYKGFESGTLHQVYKEDYGIMVDSNIDYIRPVFVKESKLIPVEDSYDSRHRYLPIIKKGDIVSNTEVKIMIYIEASKNGRDGLWIGVTNYGFSNISEHGELTGVQRKISWGYRFPFPKEGKCSFAMMVTVKSLGYLSSIQFSIVKINTINDGPDFMERANPITLCRL